MTALSLELLRKLQSSTPNDAWTELFTFAWETCSPELSPNKAASELGMGPSNILQERCEWGSDLNGDGFEDPIFLWDRGSRRLQISLFILGRTNADQPIVRQVQSVLFLRNIPES